MRSNLLHTNFNTTYLVIKFSNKIKILNKINQVDNLNKYIKRTFKKSKQFLNINNIKSSSRPLILLHCQLPY